MPCCIARPDPNGAIFTDNLEHVSIADENTKFIWTASGYPCDEDTKGTATPVLPDVPDKCKDHVDYKQAMCGIRKINKKELVSVRVVQGADDEFICRPVR